VRHDGSGGGNADVSVWKEPTPQRAGKVTGNTPQEQGHSYERILREDLTYGQDNLRRTHASGDKTRHGDVGPYETKYKNELSSKDLDQVWRDMVDYDLDRGSRPPPLVIMPELGAQTANSLARMVAIYRKLTGRTVRIAVRETGR